MPFQELMTWNPDQKRWLKHYRGKMYAVSPRQLGCPPNKDQSRASANEWWIAKQAEIDDTRQAIIKANLQENIRILTEMEERFYTPQPSTIKPPAPPGVVFRDDLPLYERPAPLPPEKTLAVNLQKWLAGKMALVKAGEISLGRYDTYRIDGNAFLDWVGDGSADLLDASKMEEYRNYLLNEMASNTIARPTAKGRLDNAKQFVRWMYQQEVIEQLPRNLLDPRSLTIKVGTTSNETYPLDLIKKILTDPATPERTKLYLLLMLNCGMYQSDIAELRQAELKDGRITRKRTKTKNHKEVPTVNYKLWDTTLELLNKFNSGGDLVLLNEEGLPLVRETLGDDGKRKRVCNITSAYNRQKARLGIEQPLKLLRKTSASLLYNHKTYRPLHTLFLGHSPRTVAEKFYVNPDDDALDEAIKWLGVELGITEPTTPPDKP